MVFVKWHGHSCFEFRNTVTILTDPHDGSSLGLPTPDAKPSIVLISHAHDDHANGRPLFDSPGVRIIDEPCETVIGGVEITGVKTYHDDVQGSRLGANVVFVFELDGVRFAHLGDLGHVLSDEQLGVMGRVDVLLVGTGRTFDLAERNIERVGPRIVVPMHYNVEGIIFPYFPLAEVDDFVKGKKNVRFLNEPMTTYHKEELPGEMEFNIFSL